MQRSTGLSQSDEFCICLLCSVNTVDEDSADNEAHLVGPQLLLCEGCLLVAHPLPSPGRDAPTFNASARVHPGSGTGPRPGTGPGPCPGPGPNPSSGTATSGSAQR